MVKTKLSRIFKGYPNLKKGRSPHLNSKITKVFGKVVRVYQSLHRQKSSTK